MSSNTLLVVRSLDRILTDSLCYPPFTRNTQIFSGSVGSGRHCYHVIGTVRSVACRLLFRISSVCVVRLGKSRCLYRAHVWLRHKVKSFVAHNLHFSSPSTQRTGWWAIIPLRVIFSSIFHPVTILQAECSYFPPTHHTSSKAFFKFLRLQCECVCGCESLFSQWTILHVIAPIT